MSGADLQTPPRPRHPVWRWFAVMLPAYFLLGTALYFGAWTARSTAVEYAIYCAIHDGGFEVAAAPIIEYEFTGFGYALKFQNLHAVSSSMRAGSEDNPNLGTAADQASQGNEGTPTLPQGPPGGNTATAVEPEVPECPGPPRQDRSTIGVSVEENTGDTSTSRTGNLPASCKPLEISRVSFLPPNVSQSATYESIARAIEGCAGRDDRDQATRLCTGTRDAAQRDLCAVSRNLTGALYDYDRTEWGLLSKTLGILASVQFGIFQLFAVGLALVGIYRGRHLVADLSAQDNRSFGRSIASIDDTIKIAIEGTAGKSDKAARYRGRMRDFRDEAVKLISDLKDWSGTIVQLGLLGTLTGMVLLFASLERGESADALTAQLALSEMLGSLGLAFGTTIFAILVSMAYTRQIDLDSKAVMARIRQETDRGELRLQEDEIPAAETSTPDFNLFDLGSKWLGTRTQLTESPRIDELKQKRWHRLWLLSGSVMIAAVMLLVLAFVLLGVLSIEGWVGG